MDDRCHRNFPINCEEDAYALFALVNFNIYAILETYNKKTMSNFNKFADDNKIMLWTGDGYLQLLKEVTDHTVAKPKRCRIFNYACDLFRRGVNDTYDKQFLKAVRYMYKKRIMDFHEENILKGYIDKYVETYPDKLKNMIPLIKFVEAHAENKNLKESAEKVKNHLIKIR